MPAPTMVSQPSATGPPPPLPPSSAVGVGGVGQRGRCAGGGAEAWWAIGDPPVGSHRAEREDREDGGGEEWRASWAPWDTLGEGEADRS